MTSYPIRTIASAPEESKPVLEQLQQTFGLIPNIAGAIANSPELIKAFIGLFQQVHAGTFTEAEIQTLLLTNAVTNSSTWPVAFHTMLALKEGLAPADIEAIRAGRLPVDKRHAALSTLARKLIETRGHVSERDLTAFLEAGFKREQTLEILAVIAASTITNYVGTVAEPPLEDFLHQHAWQA
ncbi:carboxymuconolactone decarboxylase family protein [Methylovirgula sp. 4M-Z18]|uniref:carboxymuconolactone decarboxylase family protein n=1 Tax=Methylovirgula sp. 4M-Z18 TaxID=2293567 RepID=UPI000E2F7108|nr:carboxymuconolactone decarboxylase family protein [Methylovirgula sp. 4M-Z18]RFB79357.1 carboxymuconolactone decarboxylase family protein [Methylovirgula sp. 4M-Z18]